MKVFNTVVKVVVALAAAAGAVYVVATYGDKIVSWAKNLMGGCKCGGACTCGSSESSEIPEETPEAEAPADGTPVEAEEPAESVEREPASDGTIVADDTDFEG